MTRRPQSPHPWLRGEVEALRTKWLELDSRGSGNAVMTRSRAPSLIGAGPAAFGGSRLQPAVWLSMEIRPTRLQPGKTPGRHGCLSRAAGNSAACTCVLVRVSILRRADLMDTSLASARPDVHLVKPGLINKLIDSSNTAGQYHA